MKPDELKARLQWSLEEKIEYSLEKIWEFYHYHSGNVIVSFSGGKDSSVLLWLVRKQFPDTKALFVNTRVEYPELVKFTLKTPNVSVIYPKYRFDKIIKNYGYPMVSKKVSRFVHDLQNPTVRNEKTRILRDTGYTKDGRSLPRYKIPKKWRFMVDSQFRFSDRCCVFLKEIPLHGMKTNAFVGTLANDSQRRLLGYLKHGCNWLGKRPRSMPLGFWTQNDVVRCIAENDIPVCDIYGDLVQTGDVYEFSKMQHTGCIFCGFGVQFEQRPNRFEKLRTTHPRLHGYAMRKLGIGDVLDFMQKNCNNKDLFNY